jgi:hypothetical protein
MDREIRNRSVAPVIFCCQDNQFRRGRPHLSIIYSCNLCGETIADGEAFVTLNGNGDRSDNIWRTGWVGHYHSRSDSDCWRRILESIRDFDGSAGRLDHIPIATEDEIATKRGGHLRPILLSDRAARVASATSLELSLRTRNLLAAAGIEAVSGLRARLADGTIGDVPGIGPRRLQEIRAALASQADAA